MSTHPESVINAWRKAAGDKKIVLHICAAATGNDPLYPRYQEAGWHEIRVNPHASAKPDLVATMADLSAIPDNAVDAIWVNHALANVPPPALPKALAECYRVLKEEGEMGACVPDSAAVAAHIAHGRLEQPLYKNAAGTPMRPMDMLYGNAKIGARYTGFSAESLIQKARDAGFATITVMRKEMHLWLGSFKYPKGHAKYVEKARVLQDKLPEQPPAPPLTGNTHPGLTHKGKVADELDVPPKIWDMA